MTATVVSLGLADVFMALIMLAMNQRIKFITAERDDLRQHLKNAQNLVGLQRGAVEVDMLPIALADAVTVIAIIDRIPNDDDKLNNEDTPFIWYKPACRGARVGTVEPARTFKRAMEDDGSRIWQETTVSGGRYGVNRLIGVTPSDYFFSVYALHHVGSAEQTRIVGSGETSGEDQARVIGQMHPAMCEGLDAANNTNVWSRIHGGENSVATRRALNNEDGAAMDDLDNIVPGPWNPFLHQDRPVKFDD